ncbi:MAG: citrate/2-methylcitrate synthase [Promethearchaeota archaeon]
MGNTMECPYCKNDCSPRAIFCPKCGEVFDPDRPFPQAQPYRVREVDFDQPPPPFDPSERPRTERELLEKYPIRKGLVNVVLDETTISSTDGFAGELYYRGYPITELVEKSTFEEVAFLLINGRLPTKMDLDFFIQNWVSERDIPDRVLMILKSFPRNTTRIELLRTAISAISLYDIDDYDYSEPANVRKGVRIIAKIPTILAFSHCIRENHPIVEPKAELSHAANFYYMLTGKEPTPTIERAMDQLLILHAEHSLNASTFSARVTVSTLSDIYSAVTSAIGTLRGPLHGGANERVFYALVDEIKSVENVVPWAKAKLERKEKIMGFGHRVYKTMDPRARILKEIARDFWKEKHENEVSHVQHDNLYDMCVALEAFMRKKKGLEPNVDLYSAIVLHALGVPGQLYTPCFATARCVGWVAHAIEQLKNNKLIRPRLRYVGEIPKHYIPIEERFNGRR